eukprot:6919578-Pyramimonas_sp.AAC.1
MFRAHRPQRAAARGCGSAVSLAHGLDAHSGITLPRALRAHGSESKFSVSEQGIVACCSHATTVLEFL